jgi:hypothetical protein
MAMTYSSVGDKLESFQMPCGQNGQDGYLSLPNYYLGSDEIDAMDAANVMVTTGGSL